MPPDPGHGRKAGSSSAANGPALRPDPDEPPNQELWDYIHLALRRSAVNGAEITAAAREQFPELASLERPRHPNPRTSSAHRNRSTSRHEPANHHRGEPIFTVRNSVLGHLRFHDEKPRS